MKESEIIKILKEKYSIINKLYQNISKGFDENVIHDFRVAIKKLRAFLRLLDNQHAIEGALIPGKLKLFYKYVGHIRNIQLLKRSLSAYVSDHNAQKPSFYIKILEKERKQLEAKIRSLVTSEYVDNIVQRILKKIPGKLKKKGIKKFTGKKLTTLKDALSNTHNEIELHNARKVLKDFQYTWKYIEDEADLPKMISGKEKLKALTSMLGDFMDKYIQFDYLQPPYLNKVTNENENKLLRQIKSELQQEKETMIQQLHYSLKKLHKQL